MGCFYPQVAIVTHLALREIEVSERAVHLQRSSRGVSRAGVSHASQSAFSDRFSVRKDVLGKGLRDQLPARGPNVCELVEGIARKVEIRERLAGFEVPRRSPPRLGNRFCAVASPQARDAILLLRMIDNEGASPIEPCGCCAVIDRNQSRHELQNRTECRRPIAAQLLA